VSEDTKKTKKRGRKKKSKTYFGKVEEQAVVDFLKEEDDFKKEKIYRDYLEKPINKMVESIIHRYKLYPKRMTYEQIHSDVKSNLLIKFDKFDPDKGHKAYSYYGTICKNYLINKINKENKQDNKKVKYEDISSKIETRPDMIYYIENEELDSEYVITEFVTELDIFINKNKLNNNELKLGFALIDLFKDYENIIKTMDNKKFNKNLVLMTLREMTNLSTKEIRLAMGKFKDLYYNLTIKLNNL